MKYFSVYEPYFLKNSVQDNPGASVFGYAPGRGTSK
jgi:hypothetical protein